MNRLASTITALLATICLVGATAKSAFACPACPPVLEPTWSERFAKADVAFLAKWVKANRARGTKKAESTFEIVRIARNLDDRFKKGDTITMPRFVAGKPGLLFFVTAQKKAPEVKSESKSLSAAARSKKPAKSAKPPAVALDWIEPFEVSETAFDYITQAPSPEDSNTKRLKYYLKFFEFPDQKIADDAFNEFAKAPYKDVKAIAGSYSRKDLRTWMADPETTKVRLGLYGLMLGLCGTEKDVPFLKSRFEKNSRDLRFGVEGMIAGYLLLTGEKGMDVIDKIKLKNKSVPIGEFLATVQGLRIIDTYGKEAVSTDRLKQSFRLMLDRTQAAELILADLARWKDWTVIDRIVSLASQKGYNYAGYRRGVIRFLLAAKKDVPKDAKSKPEHVVKAEKHLAMFKAKDPKNYRYVIRSLIEFED